MGEKPTVLDLFFQITTLLAGIIPIFILLTSSSMRIQIQTIIYSVVIIVIAVILLAINSVVGNWKKMKKDIDDNKSELRDIKKQLDFYNLFNDMKHKLTNMEEKINNGTNKKGQLGIDPRIIIWIILMILLYLLLKSIGFFN